MRNTMTLSVTPLSDALGARIEGVDLSQPVSEAIFGEILAAWYRYLLLVFPDQTLSNDQHIEFSRRFGTLEVHPSRRHNLKDHPEILLLTNRRDHAGNYVSLRDGGTVWHSDLSYMAEPSLGSLLYSLDVPADGGDTEWADMYAAYEALPEALKGRIDGLKAEHQFDQAANPRIEPPPGVTRGDDSKGTMWSKKAPDIKARTPDVIHPVVRTHPETGRKALFVNRRFTIRMADMDPAEGEALLCELFDYCERLENVYRHRWTAGELILWDNRATIHLACAGVPDDQLRTMQRTTVRGEVPL